MSETRGLLRRFGNKKRLLTGLLLAVPLYVLINDRFRPFDRSFETRTTDESSTTVYLERPQALYFELGFSIRSRQGGSSAISVLVNRKIVNRIETTRLFLNEGTKFLVSRVYFREGVNEITFRLRDAPGSAAAPDTELNLRARLSNTYGVSSRFPRGYVVSDELVESSGLESHPAIRIVRFLAIYVVSFLFLLGLGAAVERTFPDRDARTFLVVVFLVPWISFLYSALTPRHIWCPTPSILGIELLMCLLLFLGFLVAAHRRFVAKLLAASVGTLLLTEVSFRALNTVRPVFIFYQDSYERFRSEPFSRHFDTRLNSRGWNDREHARAKAPSVFRIVALGDSFAYGVVPYQYNFLTLLEGHLSAGGRQTEVINMGIPGLQPEDYLSLLVNEGLEFSPDLVMVCFFVGNDFEQRERKLYEYSYVATLVNYLINLTYVSDEEIARATRDRETPSAYFDDRPSFDLARFMEIEASRAEIYRKDNPTFADALSRSVSHLVRMSSLCRARGIGFVVVLIPDEAQVDEFLQKRVIEAHGLASAEFDFDLPNERLRRSLAERDIESLDLLPVFVEAAGRERLYKPNDTHWNIAGNRLAAEALAAYFSKRLDRLTPARR